MIVPIVGVGGQQGSPSRAAMALRKWLYAAVIIILALSFTEIFYPPGAAQVSLGVWGVLTALLGLYCVRNNTIDMMAITMFGMFCFTQAIAYLIEVLKRLSNGDGFFRSGSPTTLIVSQSILLGCFVMYTCSVILSWYIFTAAEPGYTAIGSMQSSNRSTTQEYGSTSSSATLGTSSSFVPFSGSSRKIGNAN